MLFLKNYCLAKNKKIIQKVFSFILNHVFRFKNKTKIYWEYKIATF
jgi:hypothetical protein